MSSAAGEESRKEKEGDKDKPSSGISEFLGKVLEQLSVSAWLPAIMLVGNIAVISQLARKANLDVAGAIVDLLQSPLSLLVAALFAIILSTMITQAFAFEVIRLLEGYWTDAVPVRYVMRARARRHWRKLRKLERRRLDLRKKAFASARDTMPSRGVPVSLIMIQEAALNNQKLTSFSQADVSRATGIDWRQFCEPGILRRMDSLEERLKFYPREHRILPTRLGNTLRSTEDTLKVRGGDLEGFVLRNYEELPKIVKEQHDQFRSRLDMYCTLVFVFVVIGGFAGGLLYSALHDPLPAALAAAAYFSLAWVTYEASIASARGYCEVLRIINDRLGGAAG